jgi:rod shape-determining protein MreD
VRIARLVVLAFVAVILDAALAPEIAIAGARPDFLVMVVVYASLIVGGRTATVAGFAVGLAADAEIPEYLGLHALALSLTAFAMSGLWTRLVRSNVFVQMLVLLAASLAHDAIYYLFYYRDHLDLFARFLLRFGLAGGLYTAALGGVVYLVARRRNWRAIAGAARH